MKQVLFMFAAAAMLALVPVGVGAHSAATSFEEARTLPDMMRYVEDQSMEAELHEEMERLMRKLMSGELTQVEADRLAALMEEFPGPHSMMMGRMLMGSGLQLSGQGFGMMPWESTFGSGGGLWSLVMSLVFLVWLAVGILAVAWLWKQVFSR